MRRRSCSRSPVGRSRATAASCSPVPTILPRRPWRPALPPRSILGRERRWRPEAVVAASRGPTRRQWQPAGVPGLRGGPL
eukprot:15439361-Alexandrium_andersonii.AAC.1